MKSGLFSEVSVAPVFPPVKPQARPSFIGHFPVCSSHGTVGIGHPGHRGAEVNDQSFKKQSVGNLESCTFRHLISRKWRPVFCLFGLEYLGSGRRPCPEPQHQRV